MSTKTLNFTQAALDNIEPPMKKEGKKGGIFDTYKDTKEKGLVLLVSNGGAKTFYLTAKIAGRPERIKLGRFPDLTVENARKAARTEKGKIAAGINPQEEKRSLRNDTTFEGMFNEYMERYSKKHKRSWKHDQRNYDVFLTTLGKKKAMAIRKQDIQKLHEMIGEENGIYQANRVYELVRAVFNKAIEWGWKNENPAKGIKKFREKSRERFLQADELPCFFQALAEEENELARDYINLSLLTGARKSNVLSMRWDEIDFTSKIWRIPDTKTKNAEPMSVPLTDQAIDILKIRKTENSKKGYKNSIWVFPGTGDKGHLADPKKTWKRVCQRATIKLWQKDRELNKLVSKVKESLSEGYTISKLYREARKAAADIELPRGLMDLRIHDLRRTLGSWQAASGFSTAIIGKTLGHKSSDATKVYERLNLDPVRLAMTTAVEAMFKAAEDM